MWIWKHQDWPNYTYDASQFSDRIDAFYRSAERISGQVEGLSDRNQTNAIVDLMLSEAITTSAIEGETLDRDSVRSSLLNLIGEEVHGSVNPDDKAAGAASLIVDVRQNWDKPLTHDLLGNWQSMVVVKQITSNVTVGKYRNSPEPMQIISGRVIGRPVTVHYEAPPAADVPAEMNRFLDWYNNTSPIDGNAAGLPGPVRAAIAHVWFENIHPFDDGNGRVGRAISDHALSQSLGRPTLSCLATAINDDRNSYYDNLERIGKGDLNLNAFLDYFTQAVNKAQDIAKEEVGFVLDKTRYFDTYADRLNPRQVKAIARVFAEGRKGFIGGLSGKNYMAITKCSQSTATRDLAELRDMGALISHGQGRSTRYEIAYPERNRLALSPRDTTQGESLMEDLNRTPGTAEQQALEEKIGELMESSDVQDSLIVDNALRSGNLEDIRIALMEVDRLMLALEKGLSEVSDHDWASTEMDRDAIMERMQNRAEGPYNELTDKYLAQVAEEKGVSVWPAKEGMTYSGEIISEDGVFLYQQVAENSLIAHRVDQFQDQASQLVGHDLTISPGILDREEGATGKAHKKIEPNKKTKEHDKGHDLGR